MRKVEREIIEALEAFKPLKRANTTVVIDGDTRKVYLHGNNIATIKGATDLLFEILGK